MGAYEQQYRWSLEDREGFWADAAAGLDWNRHWDQVLDDRAAPLYRWFVGGRLIRASTRWTVTLRADVASSWC